MLSKFDYLLVKPEKLKEDVIDDLGLEFKAYKLLASRNIIGDSCEDEVIVEIEVKSRYISIQNDNMKIFEDIIIYLGVSAKDINDKNTNFIQYAHMLKNMGKL